MPEYLAPGVFIEEVSYRSKSIEGVSTTTTGFAGPTRFGPVAGVPPLITSLAEYEATYGDSADVAGETNYMWLAARAFFENGGRRLYVARVHDGADIASSGPFAARYPGNFGELTVRVRLVAGENVVRDGKAAGLRVGDLVLKGDALEVVTASAAGPEVDGTALDDAGATELRRVVAALEVVTAAGRAVFSAANLPLDAESGAPSLLGLLDPGSGAAPVTTTETAGALATALETKHGSTLGADVRAAGSDGVTVTFGLENGDDGAAPDGDHYAGGEEPPTGLEALARVAEISTVAAPAAGADAANHEAICAALITHVEAQTDYRVAVLDPPEGDDVNAVRATRAGFDSTRAALYFPWVEASNPNGPGTIMVPPSGFVAGVFARNDVERGVHKAPANEVVLGALGFARAISKPQQETLNPLGVNCLRSFENRGHRVWGARTLSSDPEWKYLNVRRYFNYLERSIDIGTQWAVFEPNGERLWANVRRTISDFLFNEFQAGALLGDKPEAAYFVKCDRSTMTQNDLDNGRLVCLVGVAALRPAEFVIFRIGQWTGDRRS